MLLTNGWTNWLKRAPIQDSPLILHNETGQAILPPPPGSEFRITEEGDQRITQAGDFRVTE